MAIKKYRKEQYPFVIPDLNDWPIVKLKKDKEAFINQLVEFAKKRLYTMTSDMGQEIEHTMYLERKRMKEEPWRIDPASEKRFWNKIRKELLEQPLKLTEEDAEKRNEELLTQILHRYANEITGNFNIKTYWFYEPLVKFMVWRVYELEHY